MTRSSSRTLAGLVQAIVLVSVLVPGSVASGAPVRGTHAYDYRNHPVVADLRDREFVILSARGLLAAGRADSLRDAGVKPLFLLQPNQAFSDGVAIGSRPGDERTFPWDTATWKLARTHEALLPDSTGGFLDMFGGGRWSSMVLDFRNRPFGRAYAALLVSTFPKAAGVVLDYGCGDLGWMELRTPHATWPPWRKGWIAFLREVRRLRPDWILVSQCDQWKRDLPVDAVLLERVGSALNPPQKSFATARALAQGGRRVLLRQEWPEPRTRRLFAGLALMFGGAFDQCADPNQVPPVHERDVEHFGLSVGTPAGELRERSAGVWQRAMTRGMVIVNLSAAPAIYVHGGKTRFAIPAGDALVLQDRDAAGRPMPLASNAGR